MPRQNRVAPETVGDLGCGVGEVLKQLQANLNSECAFWGYGVSPQAIDLGKNGASETIRFVRVAAVIRGDRGGDRAVIGA